MSPQLPLRGKPLILHVEDEKSQADMLKNILEGSGFAVLQASTAEEALRSFKQDPRISLVLADHMLSGKNRHGTSGPD
jgi:CheY-like chemotaxis protein